MFIDPSALYEFGKSIVEAKAEIKFHNSLKDLPIREKIERMKFHNKLKKKREKEEKIERRHQEICSSIRAANNFPAIFI